MRCDVSVSATGSNCLGANKINHAQTKTRFSIRNRIELFGRVGKLAVTVLSVFQYPQPDRIVWAKCKDLERLNDSHVSVSATGSNCLGVKYFTIKIRERSCFSIRNRIELFGHTNRAVSDPRNFSFSIRNRIELFGPIAVSSTLPR